MGSAVALAPLALPASPAEPVASMLACRYGSKCYQTNAEHLSKYVHPGDRGYRDGNVVFRAGCGPELSTLWEVFKFFDVEESGHLTYDEFTSALAVVAAKCGPVDATEAWKNAGGADLNYVSFVMFTLWAQLVNPSLPVGLNNDCSERPCRFTSVHSVVCSCRDFRAVPAKGVNGVLVCECGHKESMHRSDTQHVDERPPPHWTPDKVGLVEVTDKDVRDNMQLLLSVSHKETDNWTRDRGCALHGVHGCLNSCVYKNRAPVPTGYRLAGVFRNQNPSLWTRYNRTKASIAHDCATGDFSQEVVESSKAPFDDFGNVLDSRINEWRLFHGSSLTACEDVCENNFRLALAGTGATWKKNGEAKGNPLYGPGVYLTERITKADEYATPSRFERDQTLHSVLLCRTIGGRTNVLTKNEIDPLALQKAVFEGPNHSVLGDRVRELKKPYREIVVYDKDQVYPEYLITYVRLFPDVDPTIPLWCPASTEVRVKERTSTVPATTKDVDTVRARRTVSEGTMMGDVREHTMNVARASMPPPSVFFDPSGMRFMHTLYIGSVRLEDVVFAGKTLVCRWYVDMAHDCSRPVTLKGQESVDVRHFSFLVMCFSDPTVRTQKLTLTLSAPGAKGAHIACAFVDLGIFSRSCNFKKDTLELCNASGLVAYVDVQTACQVRWRRQPTPLMDGGDESAPEFVSVHKDEQARHLHRHLQEATGFDHSSR